MIAIRGATTIQSDTAEEIKNASAELIAKMLQLNEVSQTDIVCLLISTTADITSYYPAKAVREAGYVIPLYSSLEPQIGGALEYCIRFMLLADCDTDKKNIKHIYLKGAKTLRPDLNNNNVINIALDGPAGSGKSTVAKILSQRLDIAYLDTGAMYRALALYVLEQGIDQADGAAVSAAAENAEISVRYQDGVQITLLCNKDVSGEIRRPEISGIASDVSKYKDIRYKMAEKQREIASRMSCVLDGRDIGTFVLPNADFKFFLSARSEIRAARRYDELIEKGFAADYKTVLDDIEKRDFNDSNREIAPLVMAKDAVFIDTSDISADGAADKIIQITGLTPTKNA